MFNHITPPSGGSDHNEQAAEPPNSRRFADQRGIALQTIIIMVVLLAIAGAVVVVIAQRAGDETDRLENQDSVDFSKLTTETACNLAGFYWEDAGSADGGVKAAASGTNICHPDPAP